MLMSAIPIGLNSTDNRLQFNWTQSPIISGLIVDRIITDINDAELRN